MTEQTVTAHVPTTKPCPCIACGKQLESAANDPHFDDVPYAGTMFSTSGHYGSTVFDSFDNYRLSIVVCDECLTAYAQDRVQLVNSEGEKRPWDGKADTFED